MSWLDSNVAVASIPVIASLGTLALSQIYSRRTAEADRSHMTETAREDRLFRAREARYDDRRSAVVEFLVAANDETDAVARFEREHHSDGLAPFDIHDDYEFTKLNQAHARLAIVGSTEIVAAADGVRKAVFSCFEGRETLGRRTTPPSQSSRLRRARCSTKTLRRPVASWRRSRRTPCKVSEPNLSPADFNLSNFFKHGCGAVVAGHEGPQVLHRCRARRQPCRRGDRLVGRSEWQLQPSLKTMT